MTTIHAAMSAIMHDVEAIKKEKNNPQGNFKYRGIDDVMNALHDSFAKHGVFITTESLERIEKERQSRQGGALFYVTQRIKFTFHGPDGSTVESIVYGTAMDSGDKADNKCLSIGLKYALLQAFLIPTEDMAEPDGQSHEVASKPSEKSEKKEDDNRPWLTDKQADQVVARIIGGEEGVKEKTYKAFKVSKANRAKIESAEKPDADLLESEQPSDEIPF